MTCRDAENSVTANCSNLGVTSVTLVFDRYDCEMSIKQLERDRRTGRETSPTYVISGRHRVPNYREFMKNATHKSALAEFICVYLTDSAPQILKEHQWLMLAGGFTNGLLVKVVEHTRILLHTIDLATTYSMMIVRCDDTDVLVLPICYCGKGVFANCKAYMNAGHCSKKTNRQRFINVNKIASNIWARCFDLLTSVTCYQRLRYNVITLQNRQANCLQHARGQHHRHAVFGRAKSD